MLVANPSQRSAGAMTHPLEPAATGVAEPQQVTLPMQIAGILRRLQDAHALVHVSRPGDHESWLSAVLEVHPTEGYLLLDELTPRDGNALIRDANRIIVSAQIQGVDISFATRLLEAGVSDGLAIYRVAVPDNVRYWQRRASYRARVSAANVVAVTLAQNSELVLEGELYDISSGGIGTRHRRPRGIVPLLGETWSQCEIKLPRNEIIRCALEIRFVGQDARTSHLRLGGRFIDISRPSLKAVEAFVAHLEREQLRRKRRARNG
jgi:c-di-GMP-binding flagellar brake protein YcgR